jgi:hypothetical protein
MAIKKSQLYSSLWASCDELRGGMDASQYKDYILTLLFMKYVSDKYAGKSDAVIEVPKGGSFADMVNLKGDKEIGEKISKIISKLAEANDLVGVIDVADFNDEDKLGKGKEMQDRLSKLIGIFESLDFSTNRAEGDDLLGDAYEYLMRHFATESGKSKGQFYTPAEVSRIGNVAATRNTASSNSSPWCHGARSWPSLKEVSILIIPSRRETAAISASWLCAASMASEVQGGLMFHRRLRSSGSTGGIGSSFQNLKISLRSLKLGMSASGMVQHCSSECC